MNTDYKQRAAIEEGLAEGKGPDLEVVRELLMDAEEGEAVQEENDALKEALAGIGLQVIDTTTDENEQRVLEIVTMEDTD